MGLRFPIRRDTLREDGVAGLVLGVQSVPDGLATGLLAGVNPLAGLYAYMVGTFTGALVTSSSFMAIQGTGAMAMIVADIPGLHRSADAERALVTLSILTGVIMLAAGLLKLGGLLRFVSNAVMVGFINAVGVNIVLGQLANFTGYDAEGANRVVRAFNTLVSPAQLDLQTLVIGIATIGLILLFERTRLGALGLVVAVVITSAGALLLGWQVATLNDLGVVASSLPRPEAPLLGLVPVLLVPAASLAFVGLVQGASITANFPNADGSYGDVSRDFVGQGAANVAAGILQGMPVGGSVSASAINKAAGARSRQSLLIAGLVMAVVIVAFGEVVGYVAMPALAGLLMLIGFRTIKPDDLKSVWRTGNVQKVVLVMTFVLTMLIPLQYAVMAGVGVSVILYVVRQSNKITVRRWVLDADGGRDRDRSAGDARARRGGRPPALREPVLRGRAGVRDAPAGRDRGLAQQRRDPPPARPDRPRDDVHGRAAPLCAEPRGGRQQARRGVHERADRRAAGRDGHHRGDRRRERLRRRPPGGRRHQARLRRRGGLGRGRWGSREHRAGLSARSPSG